MTGLIQKLGDSIRRWGTDRRIRELLWFCVPALLLGIFLRALLMVQLPYGYIQYDSADFLTTAWGLIAKKHLAIHPKKSFLTPILFALTFFLPGRALVTIPLAQHFLGLGEIVLAGSLVRLWFAKWRWFIIPFTLLVAANPWNLWYEHTLMGESNYLFFLFVTVVAGTIWALKPSRGTFAAFLLSLFLLSGTRAEGMIFFGFGLLLVPATLWGQWRRFFLYGGIVLITAFAALQLGGGSHASSLLYASLADRTPDHPRSEPGIEPYIIPMRDKLRTEWRDYPSDLVKTAKLLNDAIEPYVIEKEHLTDVPRKEMAAVFKHLILEILIANPREILLLPLTKFRLAVDGWSSGAFDEHSLHLKQETAAIRDEWMSKVLSKGLTGLQLDDEGMKQFVDSNYDPARVAWFGSYQKMWNRAIIRFRLPDRHADETRWVHDYIGGVKGGLTTLPGVPYFYFAAAAGMLAAMIRRSPVRLVHLAFIPSMLAVWSAATMVAVTNSRFRFAYEPFCILYLFLLLDCLIAFRAWKKPAANP